MKKMWHLNKGGRTIEDAVVFDDEEVVAEYVEDGFKVVGIFELILIEGKDNLPTNLEA